MGQVTNDDLQLQLQREVAIALIALYPTTFSDHSMAQQLISLDRPKDVGHGDFASSIALALSKKLAKRPIEVAQEIKGYLEKSDTASIFLEKIEVAGPGFINFYLNSKSQSNLILEILHSKENYGSSDLLQGEKINLEFVSANPTGPLHLGHTRWAALGDSLARILRSQGAQVASEFYINDRGVQMDLFGQSLQAAALNQPIPEDGYHGEYISDLAKEILEKNPDILKLSPADQVIEFRDLGYQLQLQEQKNVLENFRTSFDIWFSEKSLYENDEFEQALARLKAQGHVYIQEGATWLRTTDFGDDKDRVIMKSDGSLAYFASDCAYYDSKRERGFTINIYLLGADHHGYVGRLKAIAAARGDDPDKNIEILIGQLVKIMEAGVEVKLSKRAGTIITLSELVEKVGVDAARYTLLRYPSETPMVLDVDLLRKRTNENPVYYVQYAHARIFQILKSAKDLKIDFTNGNFDLLNQEVEKNLISKLAAFREVVKSSAQLREPHRVPRYVEELAAAFHRFYTECRILPQGDELVNDLHRTRLILANATMQIIKNGLDLLGVSAPERM